MISDKHANCQRSAPAFPAFRQSAPYVLHAAALFELAIYHRFLYRSAEDLLPGETLLAGFEGVELAFGTSKVFSVLWELSGCSGFGVVGGGSGVLVCLLGLGSSLMGFRRILSEKHLSRGELRLKRELTLTQGQMGK